VFACWTANKHINNEFITKFNSALSLGVNDIDAVVEKFGNTGTIKGEILKTYLVENIDYNFNDEKKKALQLFLELLAEI